MISKYDELTLEELEQNLAKIETNVMSFSCNKIKSKRIYLAGPWFSQKADLMEKCIYNIYKNVKGNSEYIPFRPRTENKTTSFETFKGNIDSIYDADLVVANISEKDVGTAFEIGFAAALGKDIILLGYDKTDFQKKTNLMLAFAGSQCIELKNLWKVFTGDIDYSKDTVDFNTAWENIE